jgi:hypothetical protein
MNQIRGIVIATLLAVWSFPAVGAARTPAPPAPQSEPPAAVSDARPAASTNVSETTALATREARSRDLQDFRGGSGVYIYVGSGVLLVAVIVLLVVLLV